MKIGRAAIATAAMSLGLASLAHAGRASVYVKNCTNNKRVFDIYNGKDKVRTTPFKSETIAKGDWEEMKCKPEGKGRCFIAVRGSDEGGWVKKNLWVAVCDGKTAYANLEDEPDCTEECD